MHPLDGPRFKIGRATSEIERLSVVQNAFRRNTTYHVVKADLNPHTGKYIYRIHIEGPPPSPEWGVHIGEIVHNLRSALDGLTWQLALKKTRTPASNTQFPIFLVGSGKPRKGRREFVCFENYGHRMIRDLFPKHQRMIEKLQPYKRGNSPHWQSIKNGIHHSRSNPLWWLHELNNADKHRLIQIVGAKIGAGPITTGWKEDFRVTPFRFFSRVLVLKNGIKIGEAPPNVHVDSEILPLIAFDDGCVAVRGIGVIFILNRIAIHVSQIIDSFASEF